MEETDVQQLRAAGHTDRAILDAAQIVAYYAYVNRIAPTASGFSWKLIGQKIDQPTFPPISE